MGYPTARFEHSDWWGEPAVLLTVTTAPGSEMELKCRRSTGRLLDPLTPWSERVALACFEDPRGQIQEWLKNGDVAAALDREWARAEHDRIQSRNAKSAKALKKCRVLLADK